MKRWGITLAVLMAFTVNCVFAVDVNDENSWKNAMNNFSGNYTIDLTKDITITSYSINSWLPGATLTINGHGHTITVNGDFTWGQTSSLNLVNVNLALGNNTMAISCQNSNVVIDENSTIKAGSMTIGQNPNVTIKGSLDIANGFTLQGGSVNVIATSDSKIEVGGETYMGSAKFETSGEFNSNTLSLNGGSVTFKTYEGSAVVIGEKKESGEYSDVEGISINGNPTIDVGGSLVVNGNATISGNSGMIIGPKGEVLIKGNLNESGSSVLSVGGGGIIGVNGDVNFANSNLNMSGNSQMFVDGDFSLEYGNSTMNGELTINGDLNIVWTNNGGANHFVGSGALTVYGDFHCQDGNTVSGEPCISQFTSGSFSIGSVKKGSGQYENPLPIVLSAFTASAQTNSVNVYWTTESEQNNDYFTIYRSADGDIFEEIGIVAGAGNSTYTINYSFTDYYPLSGVSYYMLKQTDYNGEFKFSSKVAVRRAELESALQAVKVYPNPYKNEGLTIDLGIASNSNVQVSISTVAGKVVNSISCHTSSPIIKLTPRLSAGVYVVTVTIDGQSQMQKLVVE